GGDGDGARLLLRRLVDLVVGGELGLALFGQNLGDRRGQRRLSVVHVSDRPNVAMRLRTLEFRFGHGTLPVGSFSILCLDALFRRTSPEPRQRPPSALPRSGRIAW